MDLPQGGHLEVRIRSEDGGVDRFCPAKHDPLNEQLLLAVERLREVRREIRGYHEHGAQ